MPKTELGMMGVDQYGNHYDGLVHPRKDLLARLGRKHAEKMYVDNVRTGKARHCGYIIGGCWIEIFTVSTWKESTA